MPAVLWVLAVGSYWTFAHRMYHTWWELNRSQTNKVSATAAQGAPAPEIAREPSLAHKVS
jgi:hypothetical protein